MTTIICSECGTTFEGDDLREVADRAFEHMKEHATEDEKNQKEPQTETAKDGERFAIN